MQANLFEKIRKYRQIFQEIGEGFNDNYFQNKDLLMEIEKQQSQIMSIISSFEQERSRIALRSHVLKNKLNPHPFRQAVSVQPQKFKTTEDTKQSQYFLKSILTENCRIQVQIKPLKLNPLYIIANNSREKKSRMPACNMKFIMFHADKFSQTQLFRFSQVLNMYTGVGVPSKIKSLKSTFQMTISNFQLIKQILCETKIHIFLQNEFNLITASCTTDLVNLLKFDTNNLNQKMATMLKFVQLGTQKEIFNLQCQTIVRKMLISPEMIELKQKMQWKKVLSTSPTRSRSPSPTLHKHKAKSVIKSKQNVTRITVLNKKTLRILIYKLQNYEKFDERLSFTQTENISQNRIQIQMQKQGNGVYLQILLKTANQNLQGFLEMKHQDKLYKITVRPNKLFQIISADQSRLLFKTQQDCNAFNALISLTENVYIRPNMNLRITNFPIEQKIAKYSITQYLFKSDLNVNEFHVEPADLNKTVHNQKGIWVDLNLNHHWMPNSNQIKIVIAAKGIPKQTQQIQINKTKQVKQDKQKLYRTISKKQSTKFQQKQDKALEIQNRKHKSQELIDVHVVKYVISKPEPSLDFILQVNKPGIYYLQIGPLTKNSRYVTKSCNQKVLQVITVQFDESQNNILAVQLLQKIEVQKTVMLILNDITKNNNTLILVQIRQKNIP